MNNQELELKVKELLAIDNFFDMIIAVKDFEKEYKNSDFFKATKISLMDIIKNAKMWYVINLNNVTAQIQNVISNLDFSNISGILDQLGDVYSKENADTLSILSSFKDIVK